MQKILAKILSVFFILSLVVVARADQLEQVFKNPPEQTKPWCYWYWLSGNISKEGITKDLENMARLGVGEAFIGNIHEPDIVPGAVKVLSEEWWGMIEHAVREADRLGVKVGMFNCPGWSQSGGPWIKPEQAMRYVVESKVRLSGPKKVELRLDTPKEPFQQIAVLAFPTPRNDRETIGRHAPKITTEPAIEGAEKWFDGNRKTFAPPQNWPLVVELEVAEPFTARSLLLYPAEREIVFDCDLEYFDSEGNWKKVCERFPMNRENVQISVGPIPFGPVAVAFPAVTAKKFRITLSGGKGKGSIAEIELSGAARLERYLEKQLGKMHPTPLPMWDTYLWPEQAESDTADLNVAPERIVDLTKRVGKDGSLVWDVPEGDWIVQRFGMTPTGVKNAPATEEATGLEVDKMNAAALQHHFDSYVGALLERMPANQRKGLRHVIADSYETGPENWTDGFAADFQKVYGYDPIPWLPVFDGRIVGTAEQSNRFLWDLRRLVADRVASNYVGALKQISKKHGLTLWLENYGHWGFPAEFLQYGGASQEISGEFWYAQGDLGNIECRDASSAGHIYGKPVISAEAFTSGRSFQDQPRNMKTRGDWAYCEGINHFVLHVNIHQPWDDKKPGMCAWFGSDFNRNCTWFPSSKSWIDYTRRCHALLQQGNNVADVAYFIGEDAPKMGGIRNPALPKGLSFDYINGEVIRNDLSVRNGKLALPHGTEYRILVLPDLKTMRPELLEKIVQLVKNGAVVLGNPPERSPSLAQFPQADDRVKTLAAELWGDCDGTTKTERQFGKGRVFRGIDLEEAMRRLEMKPDLIGPDDIFWTHRQTKDADIYFLSNQQLKDRTETITFRVDGKRPEIWNPVDGSLDFPAVFASEKGAVRMSVFLGPGESTFVVFRQPFGNLDPIKPECADYPKTVWSFGDKDQYVLKTWESGRFEAETATGKKITVDVPELPAPREIAGPWELKFDPNWGGPELITFDSLVSWTERPEPGVKYYSGTAVYSKTFDVTGEDLRENRRLSLDLGEVLGIATVKLNGKEIATLWNPPYLLDITDAAQSGSNTLEIAVVNTWWNRLVGDDQPGVEKKYAFAIKKHWKPDSPLLPSGLLGPVRLRSAESVEVVAP